MVVVIVLRRGAMMYYDWAVMTGGRSRMAMHRWRVVNRTAGVDGWAVLCRRMMNRADLMNRRAYLLMMCRTRAGRSVWSRGRFRNSYTDGSA